jgi:hypothetical protein
MAVGFGALDVYVSENKPAAAFANIAAAYAAFATRKMTSIGSLLIPTAAYFGGRLGWEYISSSNKAVNPIKGHDAGRWGREQTFASGDFKPGASWVGGIFKTLGRLFTRAPKAQWGKITETVQPLVALEKGKTAAQFVAAAPIEKVLVPEANFPARFFGKASAGRTVTMEAAGMKEAVPMITAPEAMQANKLVGRLGEAYKGTAVHEIAESAYAFSPFAMSKRGEKFLKLFGHYSPDVMRAQGLFMQQIGVTAKELRAMYKGMPGLKWMKQGWKYGERLGTNIAGNTIPGLTEQGITSVARKDYDFGSAWRGLVTKLVDPMVSAARKAMTAGRIEMFAASQGVTLAKAASLKFPWKKFTPGSGRTFITGPAGAFGLSAQNAAQIKLQQQLIQEGTLKVMPMAPAPSTLVQRGTVMGKTTQQRWLGTVAHEKLEAEFLRSQGVDLAFLKAQGHVSKNVLRGHGYFLHGIGMTPENLVATAFRPQDLKYIAQGFKFGMQQAQKAAIQATKATAAAKMASDLNKARIAQTMSQMSRGPARPAGLCHRLNAQRNGSKGVRRDFENR